MTELELDSPELLLTALWASSLKGNEISLSVASEHHHALVHSLKEITSIFGQSDALHLDSSGRKVLVRATQIEPDTYSITIPEQLGVARTLTALLVLALNSRGRVRFIVRGVMLGDNEPIYFFTDTVVPSLKSYGDIRVNFEKVCFREGGEVSLIVEGKGVSLPSSITGIKLPPIPQEIRGTSSASESLAHREVAERQSTGIRQGLSSVPAPVKVRKIYERKSEPGSVVSLAAKLIGKDFDFYLGAWSYGERSKPAEVVGKEAAFMLESELKQFAPLTHSLYYYLPWLVISGRKLIVSPELTFPVSLMRLASSLFGVNYLESEVSTQ